MRGLTQQEIKSAPDWATKFEVSNTAIRWSDDSFIQWFYEDGKLSDKICFNPCFVNSKPIPRKAFDISEHEFSDDEISREVQATSDCVQLDMVDGSRPALLDKNDVISLAKHFKLTADELK
tara:strand:- start:177 stop:539 length:363 start_codon:yes stop_codon:yes gene_type:complete